MSADKNYDVVIAGGGMIGTSLALALSQLDLRIAVVEAIARDEDTQPSFDDRSTALSRSTQRTFEALGLWPEIAAASTPIRHIHVSDKGRFGFSHIDAEEQGVEALGYVVFNRVLGGVLQAAVRGHESIDVICPAKIVDIDLSGDEAIAFVDGDKRREIRSPLLVAADGANSSVREMMGISATQTRYGQTAIIGNLLTEIPIGNKAYERFTKDGPLAFLPVNDGRAAFIRVVPEKDAERVLGLDDDEFLDELQNLFGNRLGRLTNLGKRASYPLALSKAVRLVANRSVLIGNSAHGLHPVAAQGFNLGMRDVAALCDCIADADELGSRLMLDRYAEWRRSDQSKLVHFTDNLVGLFGSTRPPVRLLRNIGMLAFDLVPGVRGEFARQTMGLAGRLPRLSRGVPLR
ncbi:MAG: 2-octaprenyl-6-methoxyphenyl hydroxylase [Woeseiaceae bacterium]|nr:2-octaprenyl-6-methoxyphenyl hydroxylase [Woeseiaceae bacterium]